MAVQGRRLSQSLTIVPKVRDPQLRMDMVAEQDSELVNRIGAMLSAEPVYEHHALSGQETGSSLPIGYLVAAP